MNDPHCPICHTRADRIAPCDECIDNGHVPEAWAMEVAGIAADDRYCPDHGEPLVMDGRRTVIWACSCKPEPRREIRGA